MKTTTVFIGAIRNTTFDGFFSPKLTDIVGHLKALLTNLRIQNTVKINTKAGNDAGATSFE